MIINGFYWLSKFNFHTCEFHFRVSPLGMQNPLEILYQDEHIVAINKPHGLLVHRSMIASQETEFAMQMLRNQLKKKVFLIHRLDRKTAGVLLFALNSEIAAHLSTQFEEKTTEKRYLAIVRGWFPGDVTVDYPLTNDKGKLQDAITDIRCLQNTELDIPYGPFQTSRYSLVECYPKTGRMHQIRKHLDHLHHPIIGDRPHGCNKQNKLFRERWNMMTMLLHAENLKIKHPVTNEVLSIHAGISDEFKRMLSILGFTALS